MLHIFVLGPGGGVLLQSPAGFGVGGASFGPPRSKPLRALVWCVYVLHTFPRNRRCSNSGEMQQALQAAKRGTIKNTR